MIDQDRRRAQSFGADPERYDRSRPSYPAALVDDLLGENPALVLDVGCGTGKAARLFAARGCHVVGVEPDERMARVARSHGIAVEVATFETWDPAGRAFDMVVSGQAWHWVDSSAGPKKAAAVLRHGGRLAVFWNVGAHEPETKAALDAVYRRLAPTLESGYVPLGQRQPPKLAHVTAIEASALFEGPEIKIYPWAQRYRRDEWLDQMGTHSDHLVLPPAQLEALLGGLGTAIDQLGGSITVHYQTDLIVARRIG